MDHNLIRLICLLSLSLISAFSVCAVIYLTVVLEVVIAYIHGGTILNTQGSDCLRILHVTSWLLFSSQNSSVSFLSVFTYTGYGVAPPPPAHYTHKPIPTKRLKDKCNLMPRNKFSMLCSNRHSVSDGRGLVCTF